MTKFQKLFAIGCLFLAGLLGADIEKSYLNSHTCQGLQVTFDHYPINH